MDKKEGHFPTTKMLKMTFLKHTSGLSYIKAAKNAFLKNHFEFFHFLTHPTDQSGVSILYKFVGLRCSAVYSPGVFQCNNVSI